MTTLMCGVPGLVETLGTWVRRKNAKWGRPKDAIPVWISVGRATRANLPVFGLTRTFLSFSGGRHVRCWAGLLHCAAPSRLSYFQLQLLFFLGSSPVFHLVFLRVVIPIFHSIPSILTDSCEAPARLCPPLSRFLNLTIASSVPVPDGFLTGTPSTSLHPPVVCWVGRTPARYLNAAFVSCFFSIITSPTNTDTYLRQYNTLLLPSRHPASLSDPTSQPLPLKSFSFLALPLSYLMRLISARTTCSQKKLQSTPAGLGYPLSIPRLADHREPPCSSKGTIARQRHNRTQRASQSLPVTPSHAHFAITRTTADTPTHHALAPALGAHRAASSLLSQSRRPPIQVRPSYGDCTPTYTHTHTHTHTHNNHNST